MPAGREVRLGILLTALVALCAWLRSATALDVVMPPGGPVSLLGLDPYYHLRHTLAVLADFPRLVREDIWTHFPSGERSQAPGLFNLGLAAVALLSGADPAVVSAWSPVVLSSLALLPLFGLARAVCGEALAVLACALYALVPGPGLNRMTLGFADHHAAELAASLVALWAFDRVLAHGRGVVAMLGAVPLVLLHYTWPGAPLVLLLLSLVAATQLLLELSHGGVTVATRCAQFFSSFAVLYGASAWAAPNMVQLTRLGPAVPLAAAGAGLAAAAVATSAPRLLTRGWSGSRLALGLSVLLVLTLAAGASTETVSQALGAKSRLVSEHGQASPGVLLRAFGPVGLLALPAVPLAVGRMLAGELPARHLTALGFGALLFILCLRTRDYAYLLSPFVALMAAYTLHVALSARPSWGRPAARWAAAGITVLAVGGLIRARWLPAPRLTQAEVQRNVLVHAGWRQAMSWMRSETPPPPRPKSVRFGYRGYRYPPEHYGVISAWDWGVFISHFGQRSAVMSHSPSALTARWLASPSEPEALNRLCPDCEAGERVRYAVLDSLTLGERWLGKFALASEKPDGLLVSAGTCTISGRPLDVHAYGPAYERSIAARLFLRDGDGLRHHRLAFESAHQQLLAYEARPSWPVVQRQAFELDSPLAQELAGAVAAGHRPSTASRCLYDGQVISSVKIFEVVPGARVRGQAPPHGAVHARLELSSLTTGRAWVHTTSTAADGSGGFELTLPYPTERVSHLALSPSGPWRITGLGPGGTDTATVSVQEAAIQEGALLPLL